MNGGSELPYINPPTTLEKAAHTFKEIFDNPGGGESRLPLSQVFSNASDNYGSCPHFQRDHWQPSIEES